MTAKVIHIVCTGNTCRSPMAEGLLRRELRQAGLADQWAVSSSGLSAFPGDPPSPHALQILAEMGVDISSHRSSRTSGYKIEQARYVLAMTAAHRNRLLRLFPDFGDKIKLLSDVTGLVQEMPGREAGGDALSRDIPDPFGGTLEDYRRVAEAIAFYVRLWARFLQNPVE